MSEFEGRGRGRGAGGRGPPPGRFNDGGRGPLPGRFNDGGRGGRSDSGGRGEGRGSFDHGRGRGGGGGGRFEGGGRGDGGGRGPSDGGRNGGGGRFEGGGGGRGFDRGGGGGRFDGGRGGGRGGGGGNPHMGQERSVLTLLTGPGMTDADILRVIAPPHVERERTSLVNGNFAMPGHAAWRMTPRIGRALEGQHIIRANHFAVDTRNIPAAIAQHHVYIYRMEKNGSQNPEDVAAKEDPRVTVALVGSLRLKHAEWPAQMGYTYDGRSSLFTTQELPLPSTNEKGERFLSEVIGLPNIAGVESQHNKYRVVITQTVNIIMPTTDAEWRDADAPVLRVLDNSMFAFARNQQILSDPDWHLIGPKLFSALAAQFDLAPAYKGMKGNFASLKSCMSGLVLVNDMSVNCFLASGDMPELMAKAACFNNFDALYKECVRLPLNPQVVTRINKVIKNAKIKLNHLGHWRKARELGPCADSPASEFPYEGKKVTVAQYFEIMCKKDPQYKRALPSGKLKHPKLPTINIGSKTKPVLVPAELISVPGGQSRSQCMDAAMTANMIKIAAVRPDERVRYIQDGLQEGGQIVETVVNVLKKDKNASAFGIGNINPQMMAVPGVILPPAKLRYAGERTIDPKLDGSWNFDRPQQHKFISPPPHPNPNGKGYMYGVLVVADRPPRDYQQIVTKFTSDMERDAKAAGVSLYAGGNPMNTNDSDASLKEAFARMEAGGVRIVLVMLDSDSYGFVKLVSDKMGVTTQCVKWKTVLKDPRGFALNVMLKVHIKLGGTNHTLASRLPGGRPPANQPAVFQDPPASISWLFDKTCMLVGIDVSHAEPGSDRESMAAVVGSMDGRASQYIAHLSAQNSRVEMVSQLTEAMMSLFKAFRERNNGKMPAHVIVYRDGVSDGQFPIVIEKELPSIHGAIELMGYCADQVKVSIVICQKGHHTRLVYEKKEADGSSTFINPCPGLCVDASGGNKSITSAVINEFYLNSHAAIQGTAKPCKYALIYDEIGFKLSELELLTYWTTYLYARCNKSVSYATPAYYSHWASKRGKDLFAAGGTAQDLLDISAVWAQQNKDSTMFFI